MTFKGETTSKDIKNQTAQTFQVFQRYDISDDCPVHNALGKNKKPMTPFSKADSRNDEGL